MSDKRKLVLKYRQQIIIRAYVGPSGITDDGVFVNVNREDPEIWVSLDDVRSVGPLKLESPEPTKESK